MNYGYNNIVRVFTRTVRYVDCTSYLYWAMDAMGGARRENVKKNGWCGCAEN